ISVSMQRRNRPDTSLPSLYSSHPPTSLTPALSLHDALPIYLGSQIPNIRIVKGALVEASRIYAELHKAGAGLEYMDVGGGLGVRSEEHTSELQSRENIVCRLLLERKK